MKHLLGRILRSELDLEQLDVQIGSGTIHLKELALNTNYFNDQVRFRGDFLTNSHELDRDEGVVIFGKVFVER